MLEMIFCSRDYSESRDREHGILVARISKRIEDLKSGNKWTDQKRQKNLGWIPWSHLYIKIFQYVFENIEHLFEPFPWQLTKGSLLEKSWQYLLNNIMNDV